uniref:Uncharacterized protein n=1 Tax=Theonella swinhoei bacterial symbiont clone pSW1H8 TaxID=377638 RepID=A4U8T4_9BACT|nr:hypothetical protein [Theonella swinhoei bacterial symbiont clone pSW1H8]
MVIARVVADADQATLQESLRAVADNRAMYGLSGLARLLSGVTLLVAGWFLLRTRIIRGRWATPLVPYLFILSGVCTAISGACAVLIAVYAAPTVAAVALVISSLRWIVGKVGFAAAGVALIVAARYQWRVGGVLRRVAPVSAVIGVAMQFIWLDAATIMHRVVGTAFFLWLLVIGTMLATGRVERRFIATYGGGED